MISKKLYSYIIYFLVVILLLILSSGSAEKEFKYVFFEEWLSFIKKSVDISQIYLYNNYYCLIDPNSLTNSNYICTKYIEPIYSKVNFTDYNITSFIDLSNYSNSGSSFISTNTMINLLLICIIIINVFKQMNPGKNNMFGYIFNTESVNSESDSKISIDNFVGCQNIKKDINKVINHIKYYNIYKKFDCDLPKGILLSGPPGCGKTHLVKTIVKATGINYIHTSGSDINKIFVGSGSLTINNLFIKARASKPCLIFIDEADTLIRKRVYTSQATTGTSVEFGSTLCKLLAEMDSLKTESGIVIIFATNMPEENIDKALLRAGRVDQIIHISYPTFEERIELFKMYLDKLLNDLIDLELIGKLTYGLTGSDIKKIVNSLKINKVYEKTLLLEKNDHINQIEHNKQILNNTFLSKFINFSELKNNLYKDEFYVNSFKLVIKPTTKDIDIEINKCILGLERERKINLINKKLISYHETGHAIMSFMLLGSILPTKICISITSKTLGYTMYTQDDEDLIMNTSINNLLRQVMILYAGRCAEKIFMNEVTCGGEDDYLKARKILKRLVMNGMIYPEYNFVEISNDTSKVPENIEKILIKINKLLIEEVMSILESNSDIINIISKNIQEFGSITGKDITNIFENEGKIELIQSVDINKIYDKILCIEI